MNTVHINWFFVIMTEGCVQGLKTQQDGVCVALLLTENDLFAKITAV